MRVMGLAFIGLVVGAFIAPTTYVSATAVQPHHLSSSSSSSSIAKFFSSDAPESLHEAKNEGTLDEPKAWPEANAWLHASLSESEQEFLSLAVTGTTSTPSTATPTTVTPTTAGGVSNYCQSNPTACLNGGTCVNTPSTSPYYSCTCPTSYIGQSCQFNLFANSKRNKKLLGLATPRGRSVTRHTNTNTNTKQ